VGIASPAGLPPPTIRVATYNIHRGRGLDGQERLDRIAGVLGELDAGLIALQEVFAGQAETLAAATGLHAVFGVTRHLPEGPYGNLCLSRWPLVAEQRHDLSVAGREPRGCLRVDVDVAGALSGRLHVFNVHLGLGYRERIHQARRLAALLDAERAAGRLGGPRVLLGDFNEWFHGGASQVLRAAFPRHGPRRAGRTHPSPWPVFPLDRIYLDAALRPLRVAVHRSRLARVASDHLPAYADLALPRTAPAGGHGPGG
jgi:endonuclease/exonuclease/phosphatase family metal-dependent hydrolase